MAPHDDLIPADLIPADKLIPLARLGLEVLLHLENWGMDLYAVGDLRAAAVELGLGRENPEDPARLIPDPAFGPILDRMFVRDWPHCPHQSPWIQYRARAEGEA